jgi:hypothetical protein
VDPRAKSFSVELTDALIALASQLTRAGSAQTVGQINRQVAANALSYDVRVQPANITCPLARSLTHEIRAVCEAIVPGCTSTPERIEQFHLPTHLAGF